MDSGGGPGPPRPADSSGSHLPSSHDGYVDLPQSQRITRLSDLNFSRPPHSGRATSQPLPHQSYRSSNRSVLTSHPISANHLHVPLPQQSNLSLFPFNAAVAQQTSQLGVQIPASRNSADPNTQTSTPFSNLPFIPGVPQPNPSLPNPPNNPQRINPQANMLHQINAVASAANQSAAMQAGNMPQNAQQQSTHDFFGELEKAFAPKSSQIAPAPKGTDVLDSALSMGLPGQPSSQQQSTGIMSAQTQQLQNAQLQQQRIQQHLQLQEQLKQQLQQQQQQLRHPSALHQSLLSRQQQQIHPYLQQTPLAPGQLNPGMHPQALGAGLAGQTTLPPRQLPHQTLPPGGLGVDSHLSRSDGKTRRKPQTRRPRTGSGGSIPIVPGNQVPSALGMGSLAPAHHQQQIPILPGQLAFNSRHGQLQQNPLQMQQNQASLQGSLAQQASPANHVPGSARSSIAPGSYPLSNVGSMLGSSALQQRSGAGHDTAQSGIQNLGGGHISAGKIPQRIPQGNPEMAKFDAATLQSVLRSTNDPKIKAAIEQQLEYLRYKAAMSGTPQRAQAQQIQRQLSSGLRSNAQQIGALPQPGDILNQNPSRIPQAAILQRQQLLQKQQLFRQQQQIQRQHQLQLQKQASLAHPQHVAASGFPSQGLSGSRQVGGVSLGARDEGSQHSRLGSQILGQQLQHSNRRAQHSQSSHSQSASQGAPSDLAGEGQHSSSQNSQRQSSARRPRRSPRVARTEAEAANGVVGSASDLPVHQGRITRSRVLAAHGIENQAQHDRLSRLDPSQIRKTGVHGLVQPSLSRSPAEAVEQAAQAAQLAAVRAASASNRMADDKRAAEDRKRIARETELSNIEEQKKRRLQTAPWNDYQRILAPDYTTPFSSVADAWQRLVPYHVVMTDEDTCVSQEEWDAEIDKLSKKYKDCFRSLRESFDRLFDAGFESIGSSAELPEYGSLCKDDSLILDSILLRDYYETARKQALIAREKESRIAAEMERRRVAEMNRQRSMVQHEELIARNAMRVSAAQGGLPGSVLSTHPHGPSVSSGITASGALPPPAGPSRLPTLNRDGLPGASSMSGPEGPSAKNGRAFPQGVGAPYNQRLGEVPPGARPSVTPGDLRSHANFPSHSNARYSPRTQASASTPLGGLGLNAQGIMNANFRETPKDPSTNPLAQQRAQGYSQPTGLPGQSAGVSNQAKLAGTVPNPAMYHRTTPNGPLYMGSETAGAKAAGSDGPMWTDRRIPQANQSSGTGSQTIAPGRNEVVTNGMQESGQGGLPVSNVHADTLRLPSPAPQGMGTISTVGMVVGGKPAESAGQVSSLNGSHHDTLKSKLPGLDGTNSGLLGGQNMTSFGRPLGDRMPNALLSRNLEGDGQRRVTPVESGTSIGISGSMLTHGVLPNLQRETNAGSEKGNNSGVIGIDGRVGMLPNKANEAGRQTKGGELGGLGMGSLLNADGS